MRVALLTPLAAFCLGSSFVSADTYPRQPAVDAIHYRFAIALSQSSMHIDGEATATFRLTAPTSAIELDLISASGKTGMTVSSVRRGSAAVAFVHRQDRLRLPVPEGAQLGEDLTYTINYSGTPGDGLQAFTNIHGERVLFSEGWPNRARHWLPMIDHPYDKATGEMVVTAPAQWQVVSNGVPSIEATWRYDRTQGSVEVTLRQTQTGEPYVMNVDIDIAAPSEQRVERVRVDRATTTVSFKVKGEPSAITLDPNTWLLAELGRTRRVTP
jgi:aminopeptidase N